VDQILHRSEEGELGWSWAASAIIATLLVEAVAAATKVTAISLVMAKAAAKPVTAAAAITSATAAASIHTVVQLVVGVLAISTTTEAATKIAKAKPAAVVPSISTATRAATKAAAKIPAAAALVPRWFLQEAVIEIFARLELLRASDALVMGVQSVVDGGDLAEHAI
jgi:hypothetical protein